MKKTMKGYDIGYNLTEEIRILLDAEHKKDVELFEKAKQHILLLIGKEDIDIREFTENKQKLIDSYFKNLEERMKMEKNETLIQYLSNDLLVFNDRYNNITMKYMEEVTKLLLEYARKQ